MEQIKTLDGLRGVAALLVVWVHFPIVGDSNFYYLFKKLGQTIDAGYLGVDIFFVLSGFLITRILLNDKINNRFSFKKFYIKRTLRIFPIYYISLIFCYFFVSEKGFWPSFIYLSNYYFAFNSDVVSPVTHTWSLAVEEQFYICWPLLLYFLPIDRARKIIIYVLPAVAFFSALVTGLVLDQELAANLIYRGAQYRMLSLCFGAAMAFYEREIRSQNAKLPIFISISGLLIVCAGIYLRNFVLVKASLAVLLVGASLISLGIVMFSIIVASDDRSYCRKLLSSRVLTYFGKISYGLYLYHYIIIFAFGCAYVQGVTKVSYFQGIILLFFCLLIPHISYYFLEKPILRYKDKGNFRLFSRKATIR